MGPFGLTDENRTRNHQNHNLELYRLSYCQHGSSYRGLVYLGCGKDFVKITPKQAPIPVKSMSPMIIFVEYIDIISFASVIHSIVIPLYKLNIFGGADKNRTCYLIRARDALSQMSYSPPIISSGQVCRDTSIDRFNISIVSFF